MLEHGHRWGWKKVRCFQVSRGSVRTVARVLGARATTYPLKHPAGRAGSLRVARGYQTIQAFVLDSCLRREA
jgi:hypothetical protein